MHIPKTGGTWLKDVLKHNRISKKSLRIRRLKHVDTLAGIEDDYGADVEFGFVFRDPIRRLHSAFDSRRNHSLPTRYIEWSDAENACFARFKTMGEFARAFGSAQTAERNAALAALETVPHFKRGLCFYFGSASALEAASERVVFCAQTENLSTSLARFAKAYRLKPLSASKAARSHSSAVHRTMMEADDAQILREVLEPEYALFDLCREIEETQVRTWQHATRTNAE